MPAECVLHAASDLPDPALIDRLEQLASSLVSDVFGRWAGATGLLPIAGLAPGEVVAGPALTVRTRPGDNLVVHKALDIARPGEILVIDAGGQRDRAILGGLMGQYASTRKIAALVVDGAVRDKSVLDEVSPPVFAVGLSHLGPYKHGPGDLRGPVSIGGVSVADGDLIVADEDGVAVIPRLRAEEIVEAAERKKAAEEAEAAAITAGRWDRTWIDQSLQVREVPDPYAR